MYRNRNYHFPKDRGAQRLGVPEYIAPSSKKIITCTAGTAAQSGLNFSINNGRGYTAIGSAGDTASPSTPRLILETLKISSVHEGKYIISY